MKGWKKKLTKSELRHLQDAGVRQFWQFKNTVKLHECWRKEGRIEPCFQCKMIARKLGLIKPTS